MTRRISIILAACLLAAATPVSSRAAERMRAAYVLERVTAWARPEYPEAARASHTTGAVAVDIAVSEVGKLTAVRVLSGPDPLRESTEAALAKWRFRPAETGEPRGEIAATLTFDFTEEYGGFYATLRRDVDSVTKHALPAAAEPAEVENGVMAPTVPITSAAPAPGKSPAGTVASKPVILNRPSPSYVDQARMNATEGTMKVKVLLGRNGVVRRAGIIIGLPDGLNARALDAVSKLEFTPARNAEGEPIDSWVTVTINFKIR
jgi:TonB family protein